MNRREFVAMAPAFPAAAVAASLVLREDGKEPLELSVSVLKLQPGDTLVLKSDDYMPAEAMDKIRALVEDRFPGMKAIVLDRSLKLEGVLRGPA